jgi:hypothetical protein
MDTGGIAVNAEIDVRRVGPFGRVGKAKGKATYDDYRRYLCAKTTHSRRY